jgi:hypothetical protein
LRSRVQVAVTAAHRLDRISRLPEEAKAGDENQKEPNAGRSTRDGAGESQRERADE